MRVIALIAAAAVAVVNPARAKMDEFFAQPIPGAAADCSTMQYAVQLADDVSMSYVIRSPRDGSDATLSVEMEFAVEAWVSFGFTDSKAKMIGSEAIIGLPLEPTGRSNPGKYHMTSEKVQGVFLRDDAEQTLTDGNVWQGDGKTYLTFTKKLDEPGEIPISAEGQNYFLWAYGYENALGLHDKKTGTGTFILDVEPCIAEAGAVSPPTPPPASPPSAAVVPEPETPAKVPAPATPVPTKMPTAKPVVEDVVEDVQSENIFEEDTATGCSDYQEKVRLDDKLTLYYVVQGPDEDARKLDSKPEGDDGNNDASKGKVNNDKGTVSADNSKGGTLYVRMEYEGEAWLSLGIAQSSEGKMIGSEAVIALPNDPVGFSNPGEYHMISEQNAGVFLMDEDEQKLIDGSVLQEDGKTIMTFTKRLSEEGKLPLLGSGESTFLYAYGFSNDLNLHKASGAFRLTLSPCTEGSASGVINDVSLQSLSKYTSEQRWRMWAAHAFLGLFAWAVFAPVAISASWLRKLFQTWGGLWCKVHIYFNMLAFLFTLATVFIAIALYRDEKKEHFVGAHEAMGLAITLLVCVQAGFGIFRPPAPKKDANGDVQTQEDTKIVETSESMEVEGTMRSLGETDSDSYDASNSQYQRKRLMSLRVRVAWEASHKLVGVFLLIMSLWQVQSGLVLFSQKFGTTDYTPAYFGYLGAFAVVFMALTMYMQIREVGQ